MKRHAMLSVTVVLAILCLIGAPAALVAGSVVGKSISARMQGTWSSLIAIPPNDILGNQETMYLPELDSFTRDGNAITSSAASVLPIVVDVGEYLVAMEIGQGNWRFMNDNFVMTQWRFMTDASTGLPLGYLKVTSEWSLVNGMQAEGLYMAEMLQLDMSTPYTSDGSPVVIEGPFTLFRLPVEPLP